MDNHSYYCEVSLGNASIVETEMMKKALRNFLNSFYIKHRFSKEPFDGYGDTGYYYHVCVLVEDNTFLRVLRFSTALAAFCQYWRMCLVEIRLD